MIFKRSYELLSNLHIQSLNITIQYLLYSNSFCTVHFSRRSYSCLSWKLDNGNGFRKYFLSIYTEKNVTKNYCISDLTHHVLCKLFFLKTLIDCLYWSCNHSTKQYQTWYNNKTDLKRKSWKHKYLRYWHMVNTKHVLTCINGKLFHNPNIHLYSVIYKMRIVLKRFKKCLAFLLQWYNDLSLITFMRIVYYSSCTGIYLELS